MLRTRFAASDDGYKKARIMRACGHGQAIIFWYLLRVCPAFVAVCTNASTLVGVPTVGCEWFAHCCASSASISMVSSIMVRALILSLPIWTVGPITCWPPADTDLRSAAIFSVRLSPTSTATAPPTLVDCCPAMSVSSFPSILASLLPFTAWL